VGHREVQGGDDAAAAGVEFRFGGVACGACDCFPGMEVLETQEDSPKEARRFIAVACLRVAGVGFGVVRYRALARASRFESQLERNGCCLAFSHCAAVSGFRQAAGTRRAALQVPVRSRRADGRGAAASCGACAFVAQSRGDGWNQVRPGRSMVVAKTSTSRKDALPLVSSPSRKQTHSS